MRAARALAALGLAITGLAAWGQGGAGVILAGRMGERALLVIDGRPQTLAVGNTVAGVRLLRWEGDNAVVALAGGTLTLRIGGAPAQIGAVSMPAAGAREIVVTAGPGGHFTPAGTINGKAVRFMVDTGATLIALGRDDAERLGLDLRSARAGVSHTANGPVAVHMVTLDRVRVGEVELVNVAAVVLPAAMPFVLLGNSFLGRFQMRRDNDVMRLELR